MKLCPQCKKTQIDDKYSMCLSCLKETGKSNQSVDLSEIKKILEQQNWNYGAIQKWIKVSLLNQLETLKHHQGLTKIQQQIHISLLESLEKDFKNIKDISGELENARKDYDQE